MTTIPYLEEQLRDTEKDLNYYKNYCERLRNKNKKQKEINQKAIEYINKFKDSPEYIDAYDITYWQEKVLSILEDKEV